MIDPNPMIDDDEYWQALLDEAAEEHWANLQAKQQAEQDAARWAELEEQREAEEAEERAVERALERRHAELRRAASRRLLDRLLDAAKSGNLDVKDRTYCEEMVAFHETDYTLSQRQVKKALAILASLDDVPVAA